MAAVDVDHVVIPIRVVPDTEISDDQIVTCEIVLQPHGRAAQGKALDVDFLQVTIRIKYGRFLLLVWATNWPPCPSIVPRPTMATFVRFSP